MSVTIRVRRTCWACENFRVELGSPRFSPVTPGEPPEVICRQGHFEPRSHYELKELIEPLNLRKAAEKCGDFTINREVVG